MAEELSKQEQKALMADAKTRGMNRRDRKKFLSSIRSGDEDALKAAETNVFKPYAATSEKFDEAKRAEGSVTDERSREQLLFDPGEFRVSGGMTEVGQVATGLGRLDESLVAGLGGQGALLYDDVTGKLYRTENWKDVQRNADSLVSEKGERQRVAGARADSGAAWNESRAVAVRPGGSGPGGIDIIYGYDEDVPAPGTEEFRKWMNDKLQEGQIRQGDRNRYSKEKGGTGSSYGQFGSITVSDWIALGRPRKVGNDTVLDYDKLSEYDDDDLRGDAVLYVRDLEKRKHGIEKGLNSLGSGIGLDRLGSETLGAVDTLGDLGILAGAPGVLAAGISKAQEGYSQARDAGASTGSATKAGAKLGGYEVASKSIDAVQAALTTAAILTAWTGVGGAGFGAAASGAAAIGAGIAAGAATGYGAGLAEYGVQSTLYGGYDSGEMLKRGEKKGAAGAISGGVQAAGMVLAPSAGSGEWFGFAKHPLQTAGVMAAQAGKSYATSTLVYGVDGSQAERAALLSGMSVVASNALGQIGAQAGAGWNSLFGDASTTVVQPTAGIYSDMVDVGGDGKAVPRLASPFAREGAAAVSNAANLGFGERVVSLSRVFRNEVAARAYSGSRVANAMPSSMFLRHVAGAGTATRRSQQYLGQTGATAEANLVYQQNLPTSDLADPQLAYRLGYGAVFLGAGPRRPVPSMSEITADAQQRVLRSPVAWWDAFAYPKGKAPKRSENR